MKPLAILAAYNEADIIAEVVTDLLAQGCDVHFIDNWSTDGTFEIAKSLTFVELFPGDGPPRFGSLRDMLKRKEEIALANPGRWIIHTDADEIRRSPFRGANLRDGLRIVTESGYNRVNFRLLNFRPTQGEPYPSLAAFTHFEEMNATPTQLAQQKAWFQGSGRVDLASSGGHTVAFEGASDYPEKFILKHYPIRSQAHGHRKIFKERETRWCPDERRELGWHGQYKQFSPCASFVWDRAQLTEWRDGLFLV